MKKIALIIASFISISIQVNAKIWRVNNIPGVTADFTTAQAAHDAASVGDTIHLEPSFNSYGNLTTTKRLVWLSVGQFLAENNPGVQFSNSPAVLGTININAGSDGTVLSVTSSSSLTVNAPNVNVVRSYFGNLITVSASATNCVVTQCYGWYINLNSTNTLVSNNIFGVGISMGGNTTSAIITNNVVNISYRNESITGPNNIYNSIYQNNISIKGGNINFSNSIPTYNMCPDASYPAGNNNILNTVMTSVVVNSTGTVDKDFQLKVGSPALAAGYGGIDMGAFGGSTPYKLALQSAIPAITNMSTPSSTGGNTIQVNFSAKSNN